MPVLTILVIVGLAAMAVLLACLKGFNRATRRRAVSGLFVRIEPGVRRPQGPSKTLIEFSPRKTPSSKDPSPRRISSKTVALVGVAIALGSRSVYGDAAATFSNPEDARPERGTRTPVGQCSFVCDATRESIRKLLQNKGSVPP